jgi:DNA-binding transcriptional regulator YdaS (Cro superfamily)
MSPDELRAIGERLWGRWGWQTRMAEALRVDGSTVRRWLSGATTIPGPAVVALELMIEKSVAQRGEEPDFPDDGRP